MIQITLDKLREGETKPKFEEATKYQNTRSLMMQKLPIDQRASLQRKCSGTKKDRKQETLNSKRDREVNRTTTKILKQNRRHRQKNIKADKQGNYKCRKAKKTGLKSNTSRR